MLSTLTAPHPSLPALPPSLSRLSLPPASPPPQRPSFQPSAADTSDVHAAITAPVYADNDIPYAALKADLHAAESLNSTGLLNRPLWPTEMPADILLFWRDLQQDLTSLHCGFESWIDWYEDRLSRHSWLRQRMPA